MAMARRRRGGSAGGRASGGSVKCSGGQAALDRTLHPLNTLLPPLHPAPDALSNGSLTAL